MMIILHSSYLKKKVFTQERSKRENEIHPLP